MIGIIYSPAEEEFLFWIYAMAGDDCLSILYKYIRSYAEL
jgi:hypothetical protein